MAPPSTIATTRSRPKITSKMVAYAMVEVTASIRVYAHMTMPEISPEDPP